MGVRTGGAGAGRAGYRRRRAGGSADGWEIMYTQAERRREHLFALWDGQVPGSRAPERLYIEMVQAWGNRGYDVSGAEALLPGAIAARKAEQWGELEKISAMIHRALREAPRDDAHQYWKYPHPDDWESICKLTPALQGQAAPLEPTALDETTLREKIENGWYGQIAAGSWGTDLEGYTGEALERHYGEKLNGYITTPPDTHNDDIVYELVFLDACCRHGPALTPQHVGLNWVRTIPLGWSAEQCALDNLRRGITPPGSASCANPFSEWIGAQMRGMVCGFVAPGDPRRAARLAWIDGSVSHQANGLYGEIYAAVAPSLAFRFPDPRRILGECTAYIPGGTWFHTLFARALAACRQHPTHQGAWSELRPSLRVFNWIHTFPNMVATVLALWYGEGDFTQSLRVLAHCGLDIDCNAGLVGSVLGVISRPPESWCAPVAAGIETYLPEWPCLGIDELTEWTIAARTRIYEPAG